jgi:hypothetical protein
MLQPSPARVSSRARDQRSALAPARGLALGLLLSTSLFWMPAGLVAWRLLA